MNELSCNKAAKAAGLDASDVKNLLEVAKGASFEGSKVLMKHYGRISTINNKGRLGDLVTNADTEAEEMIINYLNLHSPEISILAEESGASGHNKSLAWCVDPLDGTTNYAHGYPFFATSIGLTWKDSPILGSIQIPFLKEHYWGAPGIGSYCNQNPIKVSTSLNLEN